MNHKADMDRVEGQAVGEGGEGRRGATRTHRSREKPSRREGIQGASRGRTGRRERGEGRNECIPPFPPTYLCHVLGRCLHSRRPGASGALDLAQEDRHCQRSDARGLLTVERGLHVTA